MKPLPRHAKDIANLKMLTKKSFTIVEIDTSDGEDSSGDEPDILEAAVHEDDADVEEILLQESESDDDQDDTPQINATWFKTELPSPFCNNDISTTFTPPLNAPETHPYHYFSQFFSEDVQDHIVYQTNLYSLQKTGELIQCTTEEIKKVIGIYLLSGIMPLPRYRMYWNSKTLFPLVADALSQRRFEKLKQFLHFSDNLTANKEDKLHKVRPLVEKIRDNCLSAEHERHHAVDEQMIATKGRSNIRQYMPKKPHKWGIKVFTRCGTSGFTYDFMIYTGKVVSPEEVDLGMSGNVVVHLTNSLPSNSDYFVYFDNFFSSIRLLSFLQKRRVYSLCTFRHNRLKGAKDHVDPKKLKKSNRGSFDWIASPSDGVTVVSWLDNNVVTIASTYIGAEVGDPIPRWSATEKQYTNIACPRMIHEYNKFMGGVDLADMLLALYGIHFR
jgi:hypothetical protein